MITWTLIIFLNSTYVELEFPSAQDCKAAARIALTTIRQQAPKKKPIWACVPTNHQVI